LTVFSSSPATTRAVRSTTPEGAESEQHDYAIRNAAVFTVVGMALQLGWRAGIQIDPAAPDWPVAFVDLPTGQVSWHLPQYAGTYDLHSTPDKYERIAALGQLVAGSGLV
jgi:hypothetical protein